MPAIASAVQSDTWYAGPAGSNSISAPITNVTAPASVSAPCEVTSASVTKRPSESSSMSTPADGDRQHLEAVEADEQRDRPDRAGQHEAGVPQLDEDADDAEREHQRDDVRVDQRVERALPERHLDRVDGRSGRVQRQAPSAA